MHERVVRQLCGCARLAMSGEIGGAGDDNAAHLAEPMRFRQRLDRRPDPQRDVEPFLQQIEIAVGQ
jgi:hypothetical protein